MIVTTAHKGPYLPESNVPSLWCLTWATCQSPRTGKQEVFVALRDPLPTRSDKDQASFIHVPSRRLLASQGEYEAPPANQAHITQAARNIIAYYTGVQADLTRPANGHDYPALVYLHHETTPYCSGPTENNEVIWASACVGMNLKHLPPIKTSWEGGFVPEPLRGNKEAIAQLDTHRQHTKWISFNRLMEDIFVKKDVPPSHQLYAPNATPFRVWGLSLARGQKPQEMKLQGPMLHLFEKFNNEVLYDLGLRVPVKPPEGQSVWMTPEVVAASIENMTDASGKPDPRFRDDPRVIRVRSRDAVCINS